jgi:hypothetical protein
MTKSKKKKIATITKRSADGLVTFEEEKHEYKLHGESLTSCTTWLKKFFAPFDSKEVARNIANGFKGRNYAKFKRGEEVTDLEKKKATMKYWIKEWSEAALHGTRTHYLLEQYLLELDNIPNTLHEEGEYETRDVKKFIHGSDWLDSYLKQVGEPILYPEYLIYDEELKIAGQVDLMVDTGDNVIDIIDFKTNKAIDRKSKKGLKCEVPINDMDDCHLTKYTLQMSLYGYMLERQGHKVGKLILLHLTEDGSEAIEVKYEREVIEKLLKYAEFSKKTSLTVEEHKDDK